MATFYSSSTNQREAMPNLYLSGPSRVLYPESSVQGNMLYLNYLSSSPYSDSLAVSTQSQQNCIELPISASIISQDSSLGGPDNAFNASRLREHTYNDWRDGRSEMLLMQTIGRAMNGEDSFIRTSHLGILNGQNLSLEQSNVSTMHGHGLSLSLGTQIPMPSFLYQPTLGNSGSCRDDDSRNQHMHVISSPYGEQNLTNAIPNSKYLKAAQQLLDEVVNVRKALKYKADKSQSLHASGGTPGCKDNDGGSKSDGVPSNPQESTANSSKELSPSERQDLQNKVTKLLAILDEVDRRYKQYYHQMQIVVSYFDAIADSGAAKPYTALALQTISRHFRCLRDAITAQVQTSRKSLGEQESLSGKGIGISRLRYIDQQLRQQRAMMQPHAWRPQRGLPENSVSVLRAWLFEHFLHPYPKDSEKLLLARQTGLTRGQVANWFINARVRLWKPMIEEMYKEEIGDTEIASNSSSENPPKVRDEMRSSEDGEDLHQSPASERCQMSQFNNSKSNLISYVDSSANDAYMNLKHREQRLDAENCSLLQEALGHPDGSGRFMAYQMAELGRYGNGGVSLTLGLHHCDGVLPVSDGQESFIAVRGEEIYGSDPPSISAEDYEYMDARDRRHRLGSSHLLHDFVA